MRMRVPPRQILRRTRSLFGAWRSDKRGSTAVEFAIVAMPFLMFLFGIIAVGLFFFSTFTLENAVERASRLIRTGQAQQSGMTDAQFKVKVCENLPPFIDCADKLMINVRSYDEADLTPVVTREECLDNGSLSNITTYTPGQASQVVLVTMCYEWGLATILPFMTLGNMNGGSRLIQAATVFRTEPYEE